MLRVRRDINHYSRESALGLQMVCAALSYGACIVGCNLSNIGVSYNKFVFGVLAGRSKLWAHIIDEVVFISEYIAT